MDGFMAAGDAVDVFLKGKVRLDVGNLFELKNIVELTARYKKGNEEAYKEYEEKMEKEKRRWKLQYDANNGSGEIETDSETPCREGNKITVNGNAFLYEGHYLQNGIPIRMEAEKDGIQIQYIIYWEMM